MTNRHWFTVPSSVKHSDRSNDGGPTPQEAGWVSLRWGRTWVREAGPRSGPPIVLIHGATVPHWSFDRLTPCLAAAGYRVICFDLYGHGLSDRPATDYTVTLFRQQAQELLATLGLAGPLPVLGYSLGAAIAADLCLQDPGVVERLVLVAPLWNFSDHSRWSSAIKRPIIGPLVLRHIGIPVLRIRRRRRYRAIGLGHLGERFERESGDRGFRQALLSMERSGALGDQSHRYRALGDSACPRLLISAGEDRIVPPAHSHSIRLLIEPCQAHTFQGLEHNLMLTAPERVSGAVTAFLQRPPIHG